MRPINLTEPMPARVAIHQVSQWPLWMLAFRPFFLGGGLLAFLSVGYWLLILTGHASWHLSIPATLWHAHEMLFGFAATVAVGFILTAAQTWTGKASIKSVPDRFSFSMTIEQKGQQAAALNAAIVDRTSTIIQALLAMGIDKKAIQSLQVQFNPWIEYANNKREQKGFILNRTITVTLKDLTHYQQAIDAVLALGVSNINQFNFASSQASENYQMALNQALINAKQKASNMANVMGLKIDEVISISEHSMGRAEPMVLQSRQIKAADSYQPGEMSTHARVKVVFALKNS